jgi:hypothetical protein
MPNPHLEANPEAPAIAAVDVFIEAPIEAVWDILCDFMKWPAWNKSVSKITIGGPVQAGTSFEWLADGWKIVSCLEEVDPPRRIAWSGKTFGIRAVHVWELAVKGSGTHVHTSESFEGLVAVLSRAFTRRALAKSLAQGVTALKAEAEARVRPR